jgi:hypothetical protein
MIFIPFSTGKSIIPWPRSAYFVLTSCTPTKSNWYLAYHLTTVISDPDLYRLLRFHIPNLVSLFNRLSRIEGSVRFRGLRVWFVTRFSSYGEELLALRPTPRSLRTTPCRLSATAYSIHSQLPSTSGGRSSFRNLRTRHAVVKGTHLMGKLFLSQFLWERLLKDLLCPIWTPPRSAGM